MDYKNVLWWVVFGLCAVLAIVPNPETGVSAVQGDAFRVLPFALIAGVWVMIIPKNQLFLPFFASGIITIIMRPYSWLGGVVLSLVFLGGMYWVYFFKIQPPWVQKVIAALGGQKSDTTLGSAEFWGAREAKKVGRILKRGYVLSDSFGLPLGRLEYPGFDPRFRFTGHVLTCAPTGSGKGRGAVIPTLLEYPGSCFVVDIKGENYEVTHKHRERMGHKVFRIDPFKVCGPGGDSFDILGWLADNPEEWVSDSAYIADALVIGEEGNHWDEKAKSLIQSLCVFVAENQATKPRDFFGDDSATFDFQESGISEVRRLLTLGETDFAKCLEAMKKSKVPIVSRAGASFGSTPKDEFGSILSTARRHTDFLDEVRVSDALTKSTILLDVLKAIPMTVYLVIPPDRIGLYGRFIRLLLTVAISGVTRRMGKPKHNVLFLLDEFAQLGRMGLVENSISLLRGYGGMFWLMIQDLSQLKAVYPKWQTFLANSTKQFFGTADLDTAKYISETVGNFTVAFSTSSTTDTGRGESSSVSSHLQARALMTPDEVLTMARNKALVLIQGERPWVVNRLDYLKDPEYAGTFDENPYHKTIGGRG